VVSDPGAEPFWRLLRALGPFLSEMLIVGGWAHRLYRYRSEVIVPSHEPLFTTDTDLEATLRKLDWEAGVDVRTTQGVRFGHGKAHHSLTPSPEHLPHP
jgi:hypothetical protein